MTAEKNKSKGHPIHGMCKSPEYRTWERMIQRCTNPRSTCYAYYGGRGITICKRWYNFVNFYADMGNRPFEGAQLDRIRTNGNYTKSNCRWVSCTENNRNRRNTLFVKTSTGKVALTEFCEKTGVSKLTVYKKIYRAKKQGVRLILREEDLKSLSRRAT